MAEKTFTEMVKETVFNASINVSNKGYNECDAIDFIDDLTRDYTSDLYNNLEYLKAYCTDSKVADAIETVLDLVYYAHSHKEEIKDSVYSYTETLEEEKKDNNRETVVKVYDSLTETGKEWLRQQGYNNSEDLLNYIMTDYNYDEYATTDEVKWFIEDLLDLEVKARGTESLYR